MTNCQASSEAENEALLENVLRISYKSQSVLYHDLNCVSDASLLSLCIGIAGFYIYMSCIYLLNIIF